MAEPDHVTQLDFFGGDPKIVAELAEIERVKQTLQCIAQLLVLAEQNLASTWIQDPQTLLQLGALSRGLDSAQRMAHALAQDCETVASAYLTLESRVLGLFSRYSDSLPLPDSSRGLLSAGLGAAALGALGHNLGNLSLRTMASTLLPNQGGADVSSLARRVTTAFAGTVINVWPELGSATEIEQFEGICAQDSSQLADRMLALDQLNEPVIQIDETRTGSGRTLIVYIPGTRTWGFGSENPLDMQSNIAALSGPGLAASEAATVAALGIMGLSAGDKLVLVGHSQGGLVAKNLAETYPLQTKGVVTFGAPILASNLPKVPAIAFEHSNDPVPALAGIEVKYPTHAISVSRSFPGSDAVQNHALAGYLETAKLATQQGTDQFAAIEQRILGNSNLETTVACRSYRFAIARESAATD